MDIDSNEVAYMATAIECYNYALEHMKEKPRFANRDELLSYSIKNITLNGMVMEFGVFSGSTINLIADALPDKVIYGFDSFKGLPEAWGWASVGTFASESLPNVRENVELVVGWFDKTLPQFIDNHAEKISLLHMDCDLYSSAQTVLTQLRHGIVAGTIIVFDEYWNYPGWKRHEFAAFQEFVNHNTVSYEYIGLVPCYEQVAVRILGNK